MSEGRLVTPGYIKKSDHKPDLSKYPVIELKNGDVHPSPSTRAALAPLLDEILLYGDENLKDTPIKLVASLAFDHELRKPAADAVWVVLLFSVNDPAHITHITHKDFAPVEIHVDLYDVSFNCDWVIQHTLDQAQAAIRKAARRFVMRSPEFISGDTDGQDT